MRGTGTEDPRRQWLSPWPPVAARAYVGHLALPSRRSRWLARLIAGGAGHGVVYDARTLRDQAPPGAVEPCRVLRPASLGAARLSVLRSLEALGRLARRPIVVAIYVRGDVTRDRER